MHNTSSGSTADVDDNEAVSRGRTGTDQNGRVVFRGIHIGDPASRWQNSLQNPAD